MNKKIFVIAIAIIMAGSVIGCNANSAAKGGATDSVSTENEVEEVAVAQDSAIIIMSVRDIYNMRPENWATPEFQEAITGADEKAIKDGDAVGYFDCDILTLSQDPGNLKNVEIIELKNPDIAKVKVIGEYFGAKGHVILTMKLLDGQYYVDDVENEDGASLKQMGLDYIAGK